MEFLLVWLLFGIGTSAIASNKGYDGCSYFILGVLLGPIGLLIAIFSSKKEKSNSKPTNSACKYCGCINTSNAPFCPGCGKDAKGYNQQHYIKLTTDPAYKREYELLLESNNQDEHDALWKRVKSNFKILLYSACTISALLVGAKVYNHFIDKQEQKRSKNFENYTWTRDNFLHHSDLEQFTILYSNLLRFRFNADFAKHGFSISPYGEWTDQINKLQLSKNAILLREKGIKIDDLKNLADEYTKTGGLDNSYTEKIKKRVDDALSKESARLDSVSILKDSESTSPSIKTPEKPKLKLHSFRNCGATFTENGKSTSTNDLTLMIKDLGGGNYSVLFFTPTSENWSYNFKFASQSSLYDYLCTDCGSGQTTTLRSSTKLSDMALGKGGAVRISLRDSLGFISVSITAK